MFYVFDLDGTLTDGNHRLHYLQQEPKDWDAYNAACNLDVPIPESLYILEALHETRLHRIEIWTGRTADQFATTAEWFALYQIRFPITPDTLRMRPVGDHRNSRLLKMEWTRLYGRPDLIFEDRQSEVDWWLEEGFRVFCLDLP